MQKIPFRILRSCFLRSYLVNAGHNTRGMQNLGFIHAMAPGLEYIHKESGGFSEACRRYVFYHNCHYLWAPLFMGAFLHLESSVAQGLFPPKLLTGLKETTLNSLSGLGDSFFSGSLAISLSLFFCLLIMLGRPGLALALLLLGILACQLFRVISFWLGYTRGLKVLDYLNRLDLINKGDWLKIFNALLLLMLSYYIFLNGQGADAQSASLPPVFLWFGPLGVAGLVGLLSWRWHFPRIISLALLLLAITLLTNIL